MVCGVSKGRRADTAQIFSAFGIEMVELPLTALALARTEEKKKDAARKAYAKRNALREAVRGVEHDKPVLRSESCGGLTRVSAETRAARPKTSGGVADAIAKTLVALRAALAHLNALDVKLNEQACSGRTAPIPKAAGGLAELLDTMERYTRWSVGDDAAAAALARWAADDALAPPTDGGQR